MSAGALAITALAAGKLVLAADAAGWTGWGVSTIRVTALALEAVELAACLLLVCCEVRWPRLRFDPRRWSTVFPMGMTSAAAMTVAAASAHPALRSTGATLVWPAVTVCTVVLVASGRRRWVVGRRTA
ncbi:hypothetical protein GCM10023094_17320 [Rhodococcus olei]|uniref:Uncharacterized protein n=1 Tax=Rhodococcus olei TaxID=2161675 RepID=A0ABP8P0B4_9NOCA